MKSTNLTYSWTPSMPIIFSEARPWTYRATALPRCSCMVYRSNISCGSCTDVGCFYSCQQNVGTASGFPVTCLPTIRTSRMIVPAGTADAHRLSGSISDCLGCHLRVRLPIMLSIVDCPFLCWVLEARNQTSGGWTTAGASRNVRIIQTIKYYITFW